MSQRSGRRYDRCTLVCLLATAAIFGFAIGIFFKEEILGFAEVRAKTTAKLAIGKAAATDPVGRPFRPWSQPWDTVTVCDDSCPSSKDGHCGDGRAGHDGEVLCDLGTDCTDCGSWTFQVPRGSETILKPIEYLRNRSVAIRVKQTSSIPSFRMPYTDPQRDVDVSEQMHSRAIVELGLTQMWFKAMDGKCKKPDGSAALVADVGSNFGWYSFFAAANGCRVIAWEPVPLFRSFLYYGLQVNNFSQQVAVRERVVSDVPGKLYNLTVPLQGIWGTASINGHNIHEESVGKHREHVETLSERVDELVHEDVLVLKLDVEGFEPSAFKSMAGLFDRHRVDNFFMEYSPGVYEMQRQWDKLHEVPDMLMNLVDRKFTILHVNDSWSRGASLLEESTWGGELPALEEVTRRNLEYDFEDTLKLKDGVMGCYAPSQLVKINAKWQGCNRVPEDLHPKSFRGTFGHNTNIWAARNRSALVVGGPVGIQSLDQADTEWYGKDAKIGMGGRACAYVSPAEVLVSHRCPCNLPQCEEEATMVEKLAKQGRMGKLSNRGQQTKS